MKNSEFRVTKYKAWRGNWSIRFGITHNDCGTYLEFHLVKWNIAIGFMKKE